MHHSGGGGHEPTVLTLHGKESVVIRFGNREVVGAPAYRCQRKNKDRGKGQSWIPPHSALNLRVDGSLTE